jgi:hypothetical protein
MAVSPKKVTEPGIGITDINAVSGQSRPGCVDRIGHYIRFVDFWMTDVPNFQGIQRE